MSSLALRRPAVRAASTRAAARPGVALAALALGGFAIGTTEFVAMGLLPEIARGVSVSLPAAGEIVSAYALGVVVGAPVLATLAARFPRRTVLIAFMALYAVGNALSALAPSFGLLALSRFVAGLPHGAYFGVAALVAADLAGPERRGRAVARVLLGLSVANVIGVPFATWLGQTLGWRSAFVAAAGLATLTMLAVWRLVPWRPPNPGATIRREAGALRRPQVLLAVATGAVGGGGLFAIYSYISPILTDRASVATGLVPVVLALLGLGMVAGGLIGGRLVDWRSARRDLRRLRVDGRGLRALHRHVAVGGHGDPHRLPARDEPRAAHRPADAAHGRLGRGPDARRRAQPLGLQHGQRARARGSADSCSPPASGWPRRCGPRWL